MEDKIIVEIEGVGNVVTSVDKTIYDLMKEQNLENEVIAVIIDNDITELSTKLKEDTKMKLIKIKDRMGAKIYRSGLKFLYITAVKELFGRNTNVELLHSLDKGIYTRINLELNNTMVDEIKAKMHELVKEDIRITRVVTSRKEAISYFNSVKEYFEAAAPMLIIGAHKFLEKYTLSKWQQYWKDQVANWYGMFLHESQYLEPVMRDIEAMLESSQRNVNGTAILELHPLCFSTVGVESKDDLVKNKFGEYGEMQKGWTAEDAKGFIKVTSTALRAYYSNHKDEKI